jgi:ribosomal protein S18 acetylase RimI-like enzyme
MADAAAQAELFNLSDASIGIKPSFTEADARAVMTGLVHDHDKDSRLVFDADGTLVGCAGVPTPPDGADTVRIFGAVHPAHLGRAIGRSLIGWQLERMTEMRRDRDPSGSWLITARCDLRDHASVRLYRRFGMQPVRYFHSMHAPLDRVPSRDLPAGLSADAYRNQDLPSVYEAHQEAFAGHWGFARRGLDEWAVLSVRSGQFRPDLSVVARDGADVAGHVLAYDMVEDDSVLVRTVAVRRSWRRRGLASALLVRTMSAAAAAGKRTAVLDVDTGNVNDAAGIYERVGFDVVAREGVFGRAC